MDGIVRTFKLSRGFAGKGRSSSAGESNRFVSDLPLSARSRRR
jgi:hypothetical protein